MFQSDIDAETEWLLTASDEDLLDFETTDAATHFEPAAIRSAVYEAEHSMTIARLNLLDTISEWDHADAHLTDGARTPSAWLRSRLALSHGHSVAMLKQARGLRQTPVLRLALLSGALSSDQVDQLLHVFTARRAAYVERDVDLLIDQLGPLTVAQCRTVAGHWANRVDAEAIADGDTLPPPPETTISELRMGEILDGDTAIEGTLNAADATILRTALAAAQRLGTPEPSGDNETLEDGTTAEPAAPADPRSPAQQRADALTLIAQFFLDHHENVDHSGGSIGRAHVNIHVNLDQLTAAHVTGNAETPYSINGIDMDSVLQQCCDSSVTRIVLAGASLPIDIGRETRVISPTLRKAVTARDRTCRHPDCDMPAAFTDVHHIDHWTKGGATDRNNCCLLCRRHHTDVHKRGWTITGDPNGILLFTGPDGRIHRSRPPNLQLPLLVA